MVTCAQSQGTGSGFAIPVLDYQDTRHLHSLTRDPGLILNHVSIVVDTCWQQMP